MGTLTLAVSEDLKSEMKKFSTINWSAVAREAFEQKVKALRLLEAITKDSKLTEKDVEELGAKIKAGIAEAHEKRA